jgi:FkbM family methyltransferase
MISSFIKSTAYTLLDLITLKKGVARRINGVTIRFPAKWSRYYPGDYEKDNYSFLQKTVKPGMHILDIGAHLGLFSVASSQLTGPKGNIICFEPTPGTYAVLKETLRLNHTSNVTALQAAVSNKEGTATFYVSGTAGCNSNSLVNNKQSSSYEVRLVTIDGIVKEYSLQPSLIKIDAEGAELDVLKGGIKTFRDLKPILILGLHPDFIVQKGDSLEAIWDLLQQQGYEVEMEGKIMTKNDFCSQKLLFDVHCS